MGFYASGTFAGAPCDIWVNMSMNRGDISLLGLDGDWDSKVDAQGWGRKIGPQDGRLQDPWSDHTQ